MGLRFGRYETLQPVAAGGMAKVYRGRALADGGFERIVAIKVMHSHLAEDPEFVDMFLDEARLAAKIRHPNVVATHDVRRSPVGTFLVMDFIDGFDLALLQRSLRAKNAPIPLPVTLRITLDALAGLGAAHELAAPDGTPLELVHRDVSPQNILLDKHTGTVHLTDFGVAHAAERLSNTQAGALKGKLGYLSPEHARDGRVDARSDIYSAGVLLWELLTGKQMFAGRARVRVLADILKGNLRAPIEIARTVPEGVSAACMRALALDPENRFRSARDFGDGLGAAAHHARIDIATNAELRQFIQRSGVEEYSNSTRRHLSEEEETFAEKTLRDPISIRPNARKPPPRKWLYAAALGVLLTGGATYFVFAPQSASSNESLAGAMASDLPAPPSKPLVVEAKAPPEAAQMARSASDETDETQEKPPEPPLAPRRRPKKRMYHPPGL